MSSDGKTNENCKTAETLRTATEATDNFNKAVRALEIECSRTSKKEVIELTKDFKEIFPGVEAKAVWMDREKLRVVHLRAKAKSKLELHNMMPSRFVYVIKGEHHDESGIVHAEGQEFKVDAFKFTSSYFPVDSELLIDLV